MALFYFSEYSEYMLGKILVTIAILSGVMLTVILNTTTPASAGAIGVLAVFVLAYLLLLSLTTFFLYGISRSLSFIGTSFRIHKRSDNLSLKKAYYFSIVIALAQIIVISMQSIGGIGVNEFSLIVLLTAIGCLYIMKRTS